MRLVKALISNETDDEIGFEVLGSLSRLELATYDPGVAELSQEQQQAEVLIAPYRSSLRPIRLLPLLPKLRMVQLLSAGVDEWASRVPTTVNLVGARGAHAGPVSEWVLSAILAQLRAWPTLVRFQDQGIWAHRRFEADTLQGKKALIVGAGSIGTLVAHRLAAFGATATLVAKNARPGVYSSDDLLSLLSGHQIVVVCAPLTTETDGLIDAKFLAAMDDGALLVNVGRGRIVDTNALVDELNRERIRAALDVTEPEPLPEGHPLWQCPGLLLSPHSARTVPGTNRLCYEVAARHIEEFLSSES